MHSPLLEMSIPIRGLTLQGNEKTCLENGVLSTLDLNAVFLTMTGDALDVFQTSVDRGDRLDLITGPDPVSRTMTRCT